MRYLMSLDKALKNLQYDVRMIEFYFKQGLLTQAQYNEYLASLGDSASNSEPLMSELRDNEEEIDEEMEEEIPEEMDSEPQH